METVDYALDLLRRVERMRLADWEKAKDGLVEEVMQRPDMPALFEAFTMKTTAECRIRVVIRRAYRKRFGVHADIAHAETTTHQNYGRF
ncbi:MULTISPECIES: hypothetical protein [unclassified Ensifer]|uniref:hypothetical protein n=1 Tax=unclassified Ensifer TaxID=2633371 RepID=UPI0008130BA4|nr:MULTISPECIES: hypothetical protein [unclassified Ensifer]OCP21874.1 hypothetical protein BC361_25230 [Ensifer sp. LC54]OCP23346.1 hypothetical protein BC363_25535 [Ensifer sp. LC384]